MSRFERIQTVLGVLQLVALIASAGFVVIQLRQAGRQLEQSAVAQETTIEMDRRARALELIERFNTEPIISLRSKAVAAMKGDKTKQQAGLHDVLAYLNFFEEMAIAVLNELANEDICRLFFRSPLNHLNSNCSYLSENPSTYSHLRTLNERWKLQPKKINPLTGKP